MKIHDISIITTSETVTWDGTETGFSSRWTTRMSDPGAVCNVSVITDGAHTGTHLDAPLHFIADGHTVESLDLNTLIGRAQVVELFDRDQIRAEDFAGAEIAPGTERVLIKTDNTRLKRKGDGVFHEDYVGIDPSGAKWLVTHGIKLIGVDYLSVGPYGPLNVETHRILLGAGLVIVETLTLDDIAPGSYMLIALPPKFQGVEGSPCRALLIEGELQ